MFTYSLYGENVLNTLQSEIYYSYNTNDKTNSVGISELYGAWFPYINLGAEYTFDRQEPVHNHLLQWSQLDTRLGLIIPLRFTSGRTFRNLSFGSYYVLRNQFTKGYFKDSIDNSSFSYLLHTLSWSQQVQRAVQHTYPRFGWSVNIEHRHAITSVKGYQFSSRASLNLPGLAGNHNIIFGGAFQQRDTLDHVRFSNPFPFSRGYAGYNFSRMWKFSANYHLPLLYPDWGFGNILYLHAFRLNAFYDLTRVYSYDKLHTADQRSVGGELFFDTRWWNQYPLTFGIRVSHLLDRDLLTGASGTVFEFVLPTTLFPK